MIVIIVHTCPLGRKRMRVTMHVTDSAARTAELVGEMRASIDEAVAAMRARTEAVQQRTEMAREAGDALGSIMQAVERAHQQVRGVAGQARRMAAEIPAVAGLRAAHGGARRPLSGLIPNPEKIGLTQRRRGAERAILPVSLRVSAPLREARLFGG